MESRLWGAASACAMALVSATAHAAGISGQGTWESTLQGRDLDGNSATIEAYYDTTLDITWLADANAGVGSAFDDGFSPNDGRMTWSSANAWAAGLDVNGITGWRLPTVTPIDGTSFNTLFSNNATTDKGYADADGWVDGSGTPVSEMGHMFYVTLGNLGFCTPNDTSPGSCVTPTGSGLSNTGPFSNVQSDFYFSGSALGSSNAWGFFFRNGTQDAIGQSFSEFAWAVRSGDVSAVPVPAAVWLFGSGLLGLLGLARRQR
ncbi:DUF1566 domain-containing protein [Thiohalobacter thiocyanaticus]|uniref:DUF1566 domain-containing protein n=1 Tax=Thiohalobacter thiocyanaticus TaxID=585455 RepID=UPI001319C144|nr:DUF1566 domain-containing protein [Thiohalobacter thiocyanaticus]